MKYYILRQDLEFKLLESEKPFDPYIDEPINFGNEVSGLPKITLKYKSEKIPDSIPNVNGFVVFSQNIISILKNAGINYIQYIDLDIQNIDGEIISDNYKCLNVLKVIDAIDIENSKLVWSEVYEGETEDDRYITDILDLRLKYNVINNEPMFILKKAGYPLVFREDLAQEIVNKRCTGLEFYPAEGYSF